MRRQLGAGIRPGPHLHAVLQENGAIGRVGVPAAVGPRSDQPPLSCFSLGAGEGSPAPACAQRGRLPLANSTLFITKSVPVPSWNHPCGLGNNIGDTDFFLSKRKMNRLQAG